MEGVKELANSCPKGVVEGTLFNLASNKDDEVTVLSPSGGAFTSRRPWDGIDKADEEGRSESREDAVEPAGLAPTKRSGGVFGRLG